MPCKKIKNTTATSALSRLSGKYTINKATGCHEWIGSLSSQYKYPTIGDGQRVVYAYRVAWEAKNGPVPTTPCPDGSSRWELHHLCENKQCVNAAHVQLLTQRQHATLHKALRAAKKETEAAKAKVAKVISILQPLNEDIKRAIAETESLLKDVA